MRLVNAASAVLICGLLVACGGGGGGGSAPPPTSGQPTPQDLSNAKAAAYKVSLDLSSGLATLSWSDTFPAATAYSIEQQDSAGSWTTIDQVPTDGGHQAAMSWVHAFSVATTLRIEALQSTYNVPLESASGADHILLAQPSQLPAIVLSQPEPIKGRLSAVVFRSIDFGTQVHRILL